MGNTKKHGFTHVSIYLAIHNFVHIRQVLPLPSVTLDFEDISIKSEIEYVNIVG